MELYQDQDKTTQYNSILKLSGKDTKSTNSTKDLNGKFKWAYDAEERYMRKEVKRWRLRVSFW